MVERAASQNGGACPLPYPDRFHAAVSFVSSTPEKAFSDEVRLMFYALGNQAHKGPCADPKPWAWNVVESAKWQSWSQLGSMSQMEAMRLYVRTLDEEQPEWWARMPAAPAAGAAATAAGEAGVSISSVFQEGTWVVIQQDDAKKPLPRYEQGAALLGSQLYVAGGHYGGRYLADVWVYNLNKLQWSAPTPADPEPADASAKEGAALLAPAGPPAAAGWTVTPLGDKLLVIGGHSKVGKLKKGEALPRIPVWLVDLATLSWSSVATSGQVPCARGGHTACLLPSGDRVLVYGGEDSHRRPLADVHALDLQSMSWTTLTPASKLQPAARSGHVAALHGNSMVVFGGGSIANCYNDLWVLDLDRASWSRPDVRGPLPPPRAGHSAALVGDSLYVLGGGNNVRGCTDMLVADLSELSAGAMAWHRVCSVPPGSPLSSEGVSLMHAPELHLLVAFGGYNGKYHNSVSVYKLPPQPASPAKKQQQQQQQPADAGAPALPQQQLQQAGPQQEQQEQKHQQQQHQQQQQADGQEQQQQQQQQSQQHSLDKRSQSQVSLNLDSAAEQMALGQPLANGSTAGHQQNLLKELALSRQQLKRDLAAARQELELVGGAADAAKEEAAVQVHLLQRQLAGAQAQLAEAEKAAEEARQALSAEQARTLKLEAQLAELKDRLGSVSELERELSRYRRQEEEAAAAAGNNKGSGGLWGYISGQA